MPGYPFPPNYGKEPIVFRIHLKDNATSQELNFHQDLRGIGCLKLVKYRGMNLNNTDTLLFKFENQPTVPTYSNDDFATMTPLYFDDVNQLVILDHGTPIMGNSHVFNGSHKLKITIRKQDSLTPVIYSHLDLEFHGYNRFDQSEVYYTDY